MKVSSIKTNRAGTRRTEGFTLIEMIGVLAVIAILAALLLPKVFSAINDARVNNAAVSAETIKTAVTDHYGKYGKLNSVFGTNDQTVAQLIAYDKTILMAESLLDKPFATKIAGGDPSTNSIVHLVAGGSENTAKGFLLDGNVATTTSNAQFVVEAVLYNVSANDAKDLNDRIDGVALGAGNVTSPDNKGRVEYAAPSAGATDVYLYITGR